MLMLIKVLLLCIVYGVLSTPIIYRLLPKSAWRDNEENISNEYRLQVSYGLAVRGGVLSVGTPIIMCFSGDYEWYVYLFMAFIPIACNIMYARILLKKKIRRIIIPIWILALLGVILFVAQYGGR